MNTESKDLREGPTVFWSWQSDYDENSCHFFVRDALKAAIEQISDAMSLDPADRPSLDHDTKGARGMVDIRSVILEKIQRCSLFVADLTPIGRTNDGKWIPNPNVMIELGWAMHIPGAEYIIPVLNKAQGCTVESLPFDIRGRRVVQYSLDSKASTSERKAELSKLVALLHDAMEKELKLRATNIPSNRAVISKIVGVEPHPLDRSIWRTELGLVSHEEMGRPVTVSFPDEPRAYIRVIPELTSGIVPSMSVFENSDIKDKVRPDNSGSSSGSYGPTENGFIYYWMSGGDNLREARSATMYFEESGEIWSFNGGVFYRDNQSKLLINLPVVLRGAYRLMKGAMEVQDRLGWPSARRIEVGFVATETPYIHLPTGEKKMGRKKIWICQETRSSWSREDMEKFALRMVQSFFSVFSVNPPDTASAKNILVVG